MVATVVGYEIAVVLFALVTLGVMAGTALIAFTNRWFGRPGPSRRSPRG